MDDQIIQKLDSINKKMDLYYNDTYIFVNKDFLCDCVIICSGAFVFFLILGHNIGLF